MNLKHILTSFLVCQLICCWLAATVRAQSLISHATTANSYVERSNAWFAQSEYERATAADDLVIASGPNYAGAYYNCAFTQFRLGKLAEALADFDRAIQIDLRMVKAYADRGGVRYLLGNLERVISNSNKALKRQPKLAQAWGIAVWPASASTTTQARWPISTMPPRWLGMEI